MHINPVKEYGNFMKSITHEEVLVTVNQMGFLKASRPGGFQTYFYPKRENWHLIGRTVGAFVSEVFHQGCTDHCIAKKIIVLILKIYNLVFLKELRRVSFCNVIYKFITKILVNRI